MQSRLLVVDDDRDVRDSLRRALGYAGYAVATAANGAEALSAIALAPVDLIILDVLMPMLNGLDTCRALRGRGDATPVLVLTARDAIDDRVAGLEAGADDYLVKPFALRELLARVNALLRRTKPVHDLLGYADLTLDLTSHTATRAGAPLVLTKIEFALLELLVRNAEQVLSYDVITDRVWGYDEAPASNALQVFVALLAPQARGRRPAAPSAQRARRRLRAAGGCMKLRLTLKTRFTLVAAGAVAAVALAITAVAFVAIRTDLQNQVRQEVAARAESVVHDAQPIPRAHPGPLGAAALVRVRCPHLHPGGHLGGRRLGTARRRRGCSRRARRPSPWRPGSADSFYATAQVSGTRVMVLTAQLAPGLAMQVAEPLTAHRPGGHERRRDAGHAQRGRRARRHPARLGRGQGRARARRQARQRGGGGLADRRSRQAGGGGPQGRARAGSP